MAVTCRPAERTQSPFNEASLIAFLWGALCKESSRCSLLWGGGSWHGAAQGVTGVTSRSGHPGVLGCCLSPQRVAVPHNQAALLAGPEACSCCRGIERCLLQGSGPQVLILKSSMPASTKVLHYRLHTATFPTLTPAKLVQAAQGPVHPSPPLLKQLLRLPSQAPCPRAPCALNETSRKQLQPASIWGEPDVNARISTHHGGIDLSQKPGVVLLNSLQALQHGRDVGVTEQEGSVWGEKTAALGCPSHPHSFTALVAHTQTTFSAVPPHSHMAWKCHQLDIFLIRRKRPFTSLYLHRIS